MSQLLLRSISANAVDDTKVRLTNNGPLRARNFADSADVNILKVDVSDRIVFDSVPQSPADATAAADLVRYGQLSAFADGLKPKAAVAIAASANIDLSVAADPSPIDGYTLVDGDRILLYGQTAPAENGIYVAVTAIDPTSWTRASDFNNVSEIPGSYTVSEFGTAAQGVLFVCLSAPTTLGTDAINFAVRSVTAITGGDMITVSGGVVSVDLASTSGLESSNPGNAAGQLRAKLEASNPSLQIDGSNQLGVKLDGAGAIVKGASGVAVALETSNPTLQIATNKLGVKLDAAGAIVTGASGLAVALETSNPSLQIATDKLGVKLDAAGAITSGASGLIVGVDGSTISITGNQLVAATQLTNVKEIFTLSGTDITNQYVDLANVAKADSIDFGVKGFVPQFEGDDYSVSLTGGAGGKTRITFLNDLATGGNAALVSGDKVFVKYQK